MKMIEFQYERLRTEFENVIVATSKEESDDEMCCYLREKYIPYYRGSLNNVMARLISCYEEKFTSVCPWFVRVGGDDPLVSIEGIMWIYDELLDRDDKNNIAMMYSSYNEGMIYGCAVEIFNASYFKSVLSIIEKLDNNDKRSIYREHTKPAFRDESIISKLGFKVIRGSIPKEARNNKIALSIDYPHDFLLTSYIANQLVQDKGINYTHDDLIKILDKLDCQLLINLDLHNGFGE